MDKNANANWSVRCVNGIGYQIEIKPNASGSTSVMDCRVLKVIGVDCFEKLDAAPHPPRTKKQIKADFNRLPPALKKQMMGQLRENVRQ